MILAVIFDIDGVLIDSFEVNLKFYQDLMIKAGYRPPSREEFPNYFHLTMWDVIKTITQADDKEVDRIWKIGNDREIEYHSELLRSPDGAEETIKSLAQKYKLGIVTNRIDATSDDVPILAKLKELFPVIISFGDTAHHKPHPEPILLALDRLGVKNDEAVYIGDTSTDMEAGKAANVKTILYNLIKEPFDSLPKRIEELND